MGSPYLSNPMERYQNLKLKETLSKPSHFQLACKELSFILKNGYSKSPKNLQTLIFQDTLFAFTLLSQMQTQYAISAANSLFQSAEFALPKQKRALAVKEYKHAVVACKRNSKMNKDEQGLIQLPVDVLVHLFSFLDLQSLVSASAVCRLWNAAASDNRLWKSLYDIFFCNSDIVTKKNGIRTHKNDEKVELLEDIDKRVDIDWRYAFKTAYRDISSRNFKSYRGYCSSCHLIVWLIKNRCSNKHDGSNHKIQPISKQQIVEYILYGTLSESSSDSDSDTEDSPFLKLWSYPSKNRYNRTGPMVPVQHRIARLSLS